MLIDVILKFVNEHKKEVLTFNVDRSMYEITVFGWMIRGNLNTDEWKTFHVYSSLSRSMNPKSVIEFMELVYDYYSDSFDFKNIYKALKGDSVLREEFTIGNNSYRVYESVDSDQDYTNKYSLCLIIESKDKKLYSDELNFYVIQKVNGYKKSKYFPVVHNTDLIKHEKAIKRFCQNYLGYVPSWNSILNWNLNDCDKYIRTFRGALGDKFTIKRVLPNKCSIKLKCTKDEVCTAYLSDSGFYVSSYNCLFQNEYNEIQKVLELLHIAA